MLVVNFTKNKTNGIDTFKKFVKLTKFSKLNVKFIILHLQL